MKKLGLSLILVCLAGSTLVAQKAQVTPIMSKDLTDIPGKEGLMLTVEYAPGGSDSIHRHNADTFVYVVDGSIVMQVKGGKEVTLTREPKRKQDQTRKIHCVLSQTKGRSGARARDGGVAPHP
jgi:hypothetical protein